MSQPSLVPSLLCCLKATSEQSIWRSLCCKYRCSKYYAEEWHFFYLQKVVRTDLWKSRFRSGLCLKWKIEENRKIKEEMVCMFAHTHMTHTDSPRMAMANSALSCPHNILTGLREIWGLAQDIFLLARVAYDVAAFRHVRIDPWSLHVCHKNPVDLKYMSKIIWGLWCLFTSSKLWSSRFPLGIECRICLQI